MIAIITKKQFNGYFVCLIESLSFVTKALAGGVDTSSKTEISSEDLHNLHFNFLLYILLFIRFPRNRTTIIY